MTVSMPEVLEVLASHSYSASSSNTDLWTMRVLWTPFAMISYFFPFLISLPSLNQRTCTITSESVNLSSTDHQLHILRPGVNLKL